ncbi:MAG: hypothetical protein QM737_22170 [Ferruginibacter sp.]
MNTRRVIYLILGFFLVLVNLLVDLLHYKELYMESDDLPYILGSILGGHFLLIIGLIFIRASYKLGKKIKMMDNSVLDADIESIGKTGK